MDRSTLQAYQSGAATYAASRGFDGADRALAFAEAVGSSAPRVDLGCGPGHHLGGLGSPVIGLDATPAMLLEARSRNPAVPLVRAELRRLPFRRHALGGVWANKVYQHLPGEDLPLALADLHRSLAVGGRLEAQVSPGEGTWISDEANDLPGRFFQLWPPERLAEVVVGAGFDLVDLRTVDDEWVGRIYLTAARARTLPDTVGPGMRLLVCGLNPSLYAADAGVGYARPGNRFWPALRAAGLTDVDRDAGALLSRDRIGMTDLVKRASVGADELGADEYQAGLGRVERLCGWLHPEAVCLVGLSGWRSAVDRKASVGWQPRDLGGAPAYVMPSTSGRNARTPLAELAEHLRSAAGQARNLG